MSTSLPEQITLAILPKISGWTAMVLSGVIVYTIVKDPKRRSKTYHRLICGISVSDLSSSFWFALSTWPIPKGSNAVWAVGNASTCKMQGFFTQASICSSFYNASLSIYFLLTIKYSWPDWKIRRIEPWLHGIPIAWALLSATIGLSLDIYGNANLWCWAAPSHDVFRWTAFYGPLWTMILIITVSSLMLLEHVRRIESATDRRRRNTILEFSSYSSQTFSEVEGEAATDEVYDNIMNRDKKPRRISFRTSQNDVVESKTRRSKRLQRQGAQRKLQRLKRTRTVARQSFLFAGAFYLNWTALSLTRLLQTINHKTYFPLLVIAAFTVPIQGLPNFLVYLAPTLVKSRCCCGWFFRLCQPFGRVSYQSHSSDRLSTEHSRALARRVAGDLRSTKSDAPPSEFISDRDEINLLQEISKTIEEQKRIQMDNCQYEPSKLCLMDDASHLAKNDNHGSFDEETGRSPDPLDKCSLITCPKNQPSYFYLSSKPSLEKSDHDDISLDQEIGGFQEYSYRSSESPTEDSHHDDVSLDHNALDPEIGRFLEEPLKDKTTDTCSIEAPDLSLTDPPSDESNKHSEHEDEIYLDQQIAKYLERLKQSSRQPCCPADSSESSDSLHSGVVVQGKREILYFY